LNGIDDNCEELIVCVLVFAYD